MTVTRSAAPLLIAFAVSLLLHAAALAALIAGWGRDAAVDLAYSVELVVVSAPVAGVGEAPVDESPAATQEEATLPALPESIPDSAAAFSEAVPPKLAEAALPVPSASSAPESKSGPAAAPASAAEPRKPAPAEQPSVRAAQPRPVQPSSSRPVQAPVILDPGAASGAGERQQASAPAASFAVIYGPIPSYPPLARSRGLEGRVVLSVGIGADGNPHRVVVAQSSGAAILDEAAVETVRTWRFSNAGGRPIEVSVPIVFELRAGSAARRN